MLTRTAMTRRSSTCPWLAKGRSESSRIACRSSPWRLWLLFVDVGDVLGRGKKVAEVRAESGGAQSLTLPRLQTMREQTESVSRCARRCKASQYEP